MFFVLLFLFVGIPAAEIWLLIKVGGEIGVIPTIMIVLFTGVAGAWLAKMEGLSVIGKIRKASAEGRIPGTEMLNGVLVFMGGALLLTPGFITDCVGLLMIFPPTRVLIASVLRSYFEKKIRAGTINFSNYSNMDNDRRKIDNDRVIDAEDYKE